MNCNRTRREFLRWGAGTLLASRLAPLLGQESGARRAKNCILLWMAGGPSHIDTWDPKKDNGSFKPIETTIRGASISEHLPRIAGEARRLTIVRSMTSKEGDHERATYLLHTGNAPQETSIFPTLGSIAAKEWPAPNNLPPFVSVGEVSFNDPGFLGLEHAPFIAQPDDPDQALAWPEALAPRFKRRRSLLDRMSREFGRRTDPEVVLEEERVQERALGMMSEKTVKAFNLREEAERVRAAYGHNYFGRGCLLARRLVESGVRFVEVLLDDWDTHVEGFKEVKRLSGYLDPGMSSLVRELAQRRLLDETLVLWMGEFGRSSEVNATNGRDHQSSAFSLVLAGGGVAEGRVIGKTDKTGREVVERPVTVPDLFASLFHAFGFDPKKEYMTPERRPVKLIDNGSVVKELFA